MELYQIILIRKTPVVLKPIDYKNIVLKLKGTINEKYYMYEAENYVLLIFKIKNEKNMILSSRFHDYRKNNLFMLCKFDKTKCFS
jgi:hypothetical protein